MNQSFTPQLEEEIRNCALPEIAKLNRRNSSIQITRNRLKSIVSMKKVGSTEMNLTRTLSNSTSTSVAGGKNSSEPIPDSGRRILMLILLFAGVIVVPCLVFYYDAYPSQLINYRSSLNLDDNVASSPSIITDSSSSTTDEMTEEVRLEKVLKEASMEDKTVILTTLNEAWATPDSIFDLFLRSFLLGDQTRKLLDHLVVIALDKKAYARCLEVHSHCFALTTEGVDFSEEAYFMAPDYLKMMWRRIDFLRSVLELGYNFIFTDADIMWFRDPFRRFYRDADFQIACDGFLGNSYDLHNRPNGGFNYVISTNRTIQFYKYWYSSRETHPGKHDQDVLNMIKFDPFIKEIGLKIRFLNTAYFGGLCEPSKNLNEVCTMHANCCFGLDNKLNDMKVMLQDWRNFMALPQTVKKSWQSSWNVPQKCSLSFRRPAPKNNVTHAKEH